MGDSLRHIVANHAPRLRTVEGVVASLESDVGLIFSTEDRPRFSLNNTLVDLVDREFARSAADIASLSEFRAVASMRIDGHDSDISDLGSRITTNADAIASAESRVASLETEGAAVDERVETLELNFVDLLGSVTALEGLISRVVALESKCDELELRLQSASDGMVAQAQFDAHVTDFMTVSDRAAVNTASISVLNDAVTAVRNDVTSANTAAANAVAHSDLLRADLRTRTWTVRKWNYSGAEIATGGSSAVSDTAGVVANSTFEVYGEDDQGGRMTGNALNPNVSGPTTLLVTIAWDVTASTWPSISTVTVSDSNGQRDFGSLRNGTGYYELRVFLADGAIGHIMINNDATTPILGLRGFFTYRCIVLDD